MKQILTQKLEQLVKELLAQSQVDFAVKISLDKPKDPQFGAFTTNVALVLARPLGQSPLQIAESIKTDLEADDELRAYLAKIEVAKPGYVNFYLQDSYYQKSLAQLQAQGVSMLRPKIGQGVKVNNEFISGNPTGPLHLGNGRGGFFGDALTRVLRFANFTVTNEYYVNDAGEQVLKLGHSIKKDAEAVYGGEYIEELHQKFAQIADVKEAGRAAAQDVLQNIIQPTVEHKMHIHFDNWFSEQSLYDDGLVDAALEVLAKNAKTFEAEGALWLRTTDYGDDKDRVLVKSDGQKTYFASDCGYLLSKIRRGFDVLVLTLGADHHGYMKRIEAAARALGFTGTFRINIVQLVRLVKDGKEMRMSKRAGNVVYIDDLIELLGHDVTRFFFLMYAPTTHMNFDLGLAQERSQKNPVFYVQYAYARICSILAKAESQKSKIESQEIDLTLLTHEKEIVLIRKLLELGELTQDIARSFEVHRLAHYAIELADTFHSFYDACRVIDEENIELTKARIMLVLAVKVVLGETLSLIGVSAPEKM